MPETLIRENESDDMIGELALLVAVYGAAITWHNERLRIKRTTYTNQNRQTAIEKADHELHTLIRAVMGRCS
jgi:hypothetical protein